MNLSKPLGWLRVNLGLNTTDFNQGLEQSAAKTGGFSAKIRGAMLPALAAGAASLSGLAYAADSAITRMDAIGKTADKLGLTTDALQELRSAAEQSGVAANTLDMAMQRFGRRVAEARNGTGEAKGALEEMGVALKDAEGNARPLEAVLNDVANAISNVEDQTDRNRLAMKLFDSEGVALVNMLRDGADGLDAMRARAHDLNAVIGEDSIRAAENLRTEIDLLSNAIGTQFTQAVGWASRGLNNMFELGPEWDLENTHRQIGQIIPELRALEAELASLDDGIIAGNRRKIIEPRIEQLRAELKEAYAKLKPKSGSSSDVSPLGDGGTGNDTISNVDRAIQRLEELEAGYDRQAASVELSGRALAEYMAISNALNVVKGLDAELTDEQREKIQKLTGMIEVNAGSLYDLQEAQRAQQDASREAARDAARAERDTESFNRELGRSASGAIEAAAAYGDMGDALRKLAVDLAGLLAQDAFTGKGGGLLGSIFSGIGGLFGGPDLSAFAPIPAGQIGAGRAMGGPVMAGSAYMVGERGPEMVIPKADGMVISNDQLGGQTIYNIDARGATDPAETTRQIQQALAVYDQQAERRQRLRQRNGRI